MSDDRPNADIESQLDELLEAVQRDERDTDTEADLVGAALADDIQQALDDAAAAAAPEPESDDADFQTIEDLDAALADEASDDAILGDFHSIDDVLDDAESAADEITEAPTERPPAPADAEPARAGTQPEVEPDRSQGDVEADDLTELEATGVGASDDDSDESGVDTELLGEIQSIEQLLDDETADAELPPAPDAEERDPDLAPARRSVGAALDEMLGDGSSVDVDSMNGDDADDPDRDDGADDFDEELAAALDGDGSDPHGHADGELLGEMQTVEEALSDGAADESAVDLDTLGAELDGAIDDAASVIGVDEADTADDAATAPAAETPEPTKPKPKAQPASKAARDRAADADDPADAGSGSRLVGVLALINRPLIDASDELRDTVGFIGLVTLLWAGVLFGQALGGFDRAMLVAAVGGPLIGFFFYKRFIAARRAPNAEDDAEPDDDGERVAA